MQETLTTTGKQLSLAIREEGVQLLQTGDTALLFSQVTSPQFIVADCGPFVSYDTELGFCWTTRAASRMIQTGFPQDNGHGMALSSEVALGVSVSEHDATADVSVLPDSKLSANCIDHFNEICARHSSLIAGRSETSVRAASRRAWPVDH